MQAEVIKTFRFEAAHSLQSAPPGHKCRRLHGHSYRVEVGAKDLAALHLPLRDLYGAVDHRCLNDVPGLERATCEIMCQWIWDHLAPSVPDLDVVIVRETDTARCVYLGPETDGSPAA